MFRIILGMCAATMIIGAAHAQLRFELDPRKGPTLEVGPRAQPEGRQRRDRDGRSREQARRECRDALDDDYTREEMRACMRGKGF